MKQAANKALLAWGMTVRDKFGKTVEKAIVIYLGYWTK
jgi:hypothetical protein